MKLDKDELKKIRAAIEKAKTILLISHKSPDGDTLGSALGLYHSLKVMGKNPTVACVDEPAPVFSFMPVVETVQLGIDHLNYDLFFILDCGATHLTGLNEIYPELFDKSLEVINIDHHPTNDYFGRYNLVVDDAPSATMVCYQMVVDLGMPLDRAVATCLLTGIYTDTGSFMHSNTTAVRFAGESELDAVDLVGNKFSSDVYISADEVPNLTNNKSFGRVILVAGQLEPGALPNDTLTLGVMGTKDTSAMRYELTGDFTIQVADLYVTQVRFDEAAPLAIEAYDGRVELVGEAHPCTRDSLQQLVDLFESLHAAEPDAGHDIKAAEWQAKLIELDSSPTF